MEKSKDSQRDQWGSKAGFILAAAGSAVGLGNLWRFPVMAGQNGGGAFVLLYFIILLIIGFTLMLGELVIGRHTQLSAVGAYRKIRKNWAFVGALGVLAGFLVLSFYSVIGGWVLRYIVSAATGAFNTSDIDQLGSIFQKFTQSGTEPLIYHLVFMVMTMLIVMGGIKQGIEKYSKILMPGLLIMLVLTMVRSLTLDGAMKGVRFFLTPDFSKITGSVILAAMGQVFFSLSLGMGAMITYGSYLKKDADLPQASITIPLIDTGIALVAGLAILPAVFAFDFPVNQGPGLMFITLPAVFSQMPFGSIFGLLFFVLVLFAALTSAISLLEVCVAYAVDEWKWTRVKGTIALSVLIFLIGIPSSLSMGPWKDITFLGSMGFFDSIDFVANNILLPLGGLLMCIFIGWVWGLKKEQRIKYTADGRELITWEYSYTGALKEITNNGKVNFYMGPVWVFLIKWIAPIAITIVFLQGVF